METPEKVTTSRRFRWNHLAISLAVTALISAFSLKLPGSARKVQSGDRK